MTGDPAADDPEETPMPAPAQPGPVTGNSVSITGGTHVGVTNVAGTNHGSTSVTVGSVGEARDPVTVDDVRRMVENAHSGLIAAASSDEERVVVGYELKKLVADLDRPEEATEPVQSRWQRILGTLGSLGTAGSGLAQATTDITAAINAVTGAS